MGNKNKFLLVVLFGFKTGVPSSSKLYFASPPPPLSVPLFELACGLVSLPNESVEMGSYIYWSG